MSNVPYLHNLNINYAEQKYYENPEFPNSNQKVINVGFNRNFGRRISFGLSYFNSFGDRKDSGGILSLSYSFDNKSVYFSQSADQNTNLQLVKYDSNQVGFDQCQPGSLQNLPTLFGMTEQKTHERALSRIVNGERDDPDLTPLESTRHFDQLADTILQENRELRQRGVISPVGSGKLGSRAFANAHRCPLSTPSEEDNRVERISKPKNSTA